MRREKDSELKRQQGELPEGASPGVEGDGGSEHPGSPAGLRCSGRSPHTRPPGLWWRVLPNCAGSKGGATKGSPFAFYSISFLKLLGKTGGRRGRKRKKKKKCTWALMRLKNSWRLGGHTTLVTRWGLFPRLLETKNIREEITWKLALSGEMWMLQILNNIKYEVRGRETGRKFKKQLATIPFLCCSLSWCSGCEEKVTSTPSS